MFISHIVLENPFPITFSYFVSIEKVIFVGVTSNCLFLITLGDSSLYRFAIIILEPFSGPCRTESFDLMGSWLLLARWHILPPFYTNEVSKTVLGPYSREILMLFLAGSCSRLRNQRPETIWVSFLDDVRVCDLLFALPINPSCVWSSKGSSRTTRTH